jgi:ABC-2 type transport system permease protein
MNGRRILADFGIYSRGYLRNWIALFFSLIFPIILIALFGLIFTSGSSTVAALYVENQDGNSVVSQQFLSALNHTGVVSVHVIELPATQTLARYLKENQLSNGLILPRGFAGDYLNHTPVSVIEYYNPQDSSSSVVVGAVQGVVNHFNLAATGQGPIITAQTATVLSRSLSYIDYLVPGLIGFSILTSPMFSMVNVSAEYRKQKLFAQLSLTPLTKSEWLIAKIAWYILLTFVSAAIMLGAGVYLFGAHEALAWPMLPFLVVGPFLFVSLGMVAGSVSRTEETAAVIGNVITFPMMFLAGTFFPVQNFSPGLQTVAHALPLYYVIDGLNAVMLYGNLGRAALDLAIVSVLAVGFFIAAVLAFRWREE